jgi:hypothetical protein
LIKKRSKAIGVAARNIHWGDEVLEETKKGHRKPRRLTALTSTTAIELPRVNVKTFLLFITSHPGLK